MEIREEGFCYIAGSLDPNWPTVKQSFLNRLLDLEEQASIQKLKQPIRCRLCGEQSFYKTFFLGGWLWPDILKHYIDKHSVKPSDSFLEFCLSNFDTFSKEERKYYDIDFIQSIEYQKLNNLEKLGFIDFFRKRNTVSPLPLFPQKKKWPQTVRDKFVERLRIVETFDNCSSVEQDCVCVVCSKKENTVYTYSGYTWTSLLSHYVERHSFVVPFTFFKKVVLETKSSVKVSKPERFYLDKHS